ncbi:Protein timeless [Nymphon striatum]|nr:Protein timeless [Nymphon striatum]KAG1700034.1 Protein timeless [Nymphon striatum]
MDTSVFCAELTATCNALGYLDNDNYFKEPDCLITLKDMIRYLKHDGDDHEVRRHFGKTKVLSTDLIPILREYSDDKEILDVVLRLLVNLTNPAYLLYEEELPQEKHTRNHYLELLSHLESYKLSFTESAIWATLTNILGEILKLVINLVRFAHSHPLPAGFPTSLSGIQLSFINLLPPPPTDFYPYDSIPSFFWYNFIPYFLPTSPSLQVEMRTDDDATIHDQVLWALHLSGMEDLLLYICNSESEKQFCMHTLEIISLIFREQTPEQLASAGFTRSISEKEKDEQHSNFGGTYVAKGIKALSNREMICHKPLSESQSLNFDRTKQSKLDLKIEDQLNQQIGPVNTFIHEYNLMRARAEAHDETYYLWAMKFFMEFNRLHQFQVKLVLHLSLKTYQELFHTLMAMDKCTDADVIESCQVLKSNIFYVVEYRDSILQMITSYDDTKHPKAYLKDLAETVHLFLKMLHQYCAKTSHLVVQRKKNRKHRKKQKEKNQNKEQQQSDDNIPEDLWTSIADNLPSMLPEQHEIPSDLMPFDPTLDAEVDQKPIALFKIQKYLKEKELVRAIALLRASRDIWPDGDIFGAVGLPPEDEFLVLKEIFSADIPVPADILLPAVKAPGVVEFCLISSNFSEIPDTPLVLSAYCTLMAYAWNRVNFYPKQVGMIWYQIVDTRLHNVNGERVEGSKEI